MSKYTKTPWAAGERIPRDLTINNFVPVYAPDQDHPIAYVVVHTDAHLIVKAVNAHDALLDAAKKALHNELRRRKDLKNGSPAAQYSDETVKALQEAIAKAEGQP